MPLGTAPPPPPPPPDADRTSRAAIALPNADAGEHVHPTTVAPGVTVAEVTPAPAESAAVHALSVVVFARPDSADPLSTPPPRKTRLSACVVVTLAEIAAVDPAGSATADPAPDWLAACPVTITGWISAYAVAVLEDVTLTVTDPGAVAYT